ncbi:hypothetical protein DFH09DRAFT_1328565 [Mycena vulgaris]|nr:hypothetical protein DFH09DRAFT_1328565 [Mycena vulgaris]
MGTVKLISNSFSLSSLTATNDKRKGPSLTQAKQEKMEYEAVWRVYPPIRLCINFSILPGSSVCAPLSWYASLRYPAVHIRELVKHFKYNMILLSLLASSLPGPTPTAANTLWDAVVQDTVALLKQEEERCMCAPPSPQHSLPPPSPDPMSYKSKSTTWNRSYISLAGPVTHILKKRRSDLSSLLNGSGFWNHSVPSMPSLPISGVHEEEPPPFGMTAHIAGSTLQHLLALRFVEDDDDKGYWEDV